MKNQSDKVVLLYSGGTDSYIISKLIKHDVKLYFDLGTPQCEEEIKRLPKDVIIHKLPLGAFLQHDGFCTIPLRNLLFATIAVNYGNVIVLGGIKTDKHFDGTKKFARITTKLFNYVLGNESKKLNKTKHKYKVIVPYKNYSKTKLVEMFLRQGETERELWENSWTCYNPINGEPCGKCLACKAKKEAIEQAKLNIEATKNNIMLY